MQQNLTQGGRPGRPQTEVQQEHRAWGRWDWGRWVWRGCGRAPLGEGCGLRSVGNVAWGRGHWEPSSRGATVDGDTAALQGPKACRKEKDPPCSPPAGCAVGGPDHCLYVAFLRATSRWVIHSRVLSSGPLPPFEIKPVVLTGPKEGLSSFRSGASKVCPGTAGFTWVRRFKKDPLCLGMKRALGQGEWEGFVS